MINLSIDLFVCESLNIYYMYLLSEFIAKLIINLLQV